MVLLRGKSLGRRLAEPSTASKTDIHSDGMVRRAVVVFLAPSVPSAGIGAQHDVYAAVVGVTSWTIIQSKTFCTA
jgi:hypothetical protein